MNSKICKLALYCLLGAFAVSCTVAGLSACRSGNKWDISADSSSSVTAQLMESEEGLELRISGRGAMPDFEKGKAPWYESAADITEITVTNGIEYIGSPAFDGIDGTDYIILPSSVSAVGEDFAEDPIKIFVFDNNINFATEPKNW